jgi:hypothetical protein
MSFSEQADFSAERTTKPAIYEQLFNEFSFAGATLEHVRKLGEQYGAQQDHVPNLLQLQRIAGMITNPTNEPSFPAGLTNAFYWGEILAYRAQDIVSEGEWAEMAYPLLSAAIHNKVDAAQGFLNEPEIHPKTGKSYVAERTQGEQLQATADLILGELESGDSEFMPRAMEELIIGMTDELSERPEDRWYMILGFRFITMQVIEAAVNALMINDEAAAIAHKEQELATQLKNEQQAGRRLSKQFIKLMDKNNIDDIQGWELIPIDAIREKVMESYADHMLAYGTYDASDEDEMDKLKIFLQQTIQNDFVDMEEIDGDDFLRIGGEAIYIVYDDIEESSFIAKLGPNEFLKGSPDSIAIIKIPNLQMMLGWQENHIDTDQLWEDINHLGVVMVLHDPSIVNNKGEHVRAGQDRTVCVVMTNPNMTISKYLL